MLRHGLSLCKGLGMQSSLSLSDAKCRVLVRLDLPMLAEASWDDAFETTEWCVKEHQLTKSHVVRKMQSLIFFPPGMVATRRLEASPLEGSNMSLEDWNGALALEGSVGSFQVQPRGPKRIRTCSSRDLGLWVAWKLGFGVQFHSPGRRAGGCVCWTSMYETL